MDASSLRKKLAKLKRERDSLHSLLLNTRLRLLPGRLVERKVRCGRKGCHCKLGEGHGPFLYLTQRRNGKTEWHYIGKGSHGPLAEAVARYEQFRGRVARMEAIFAEEMSCLAELEGELSCGVSVFIQGKDKEGAK